MNTKTRTYILLFVVLSVWGVIGFKIVNAIDSSPAEINEFGKSVGFTPVKIEKIDTFSIQEVEVDPFLGIRKIKKLDSSKREIRPKILWPTIEYKGMLKSKTTESKIFVLKINKQEFLMKIGQTVSEVCVIKGNEGKIIVRFKGFKKEILI